MKETEGKRTLECYYISKSNKILIEKTVGIENRLKMQKETILVCKLKPIADEPKI